MAGSVLGGLGSITSEIICSLLNTNATKVITWISIQTIGVNMGVYEGLIPIVFLFMILTIVSNGLTVIILRIYLLVELRSLDQVQ